MAFNPVSFGATALTGGLEKLFTGLAQKKAEDRKAARERLKQAEQMQFQAPGALAAGQQAALQNLIQGFASNLGR